MATRRPVPTTEDILGPQVTMQASSVNADNDRIDHALRLRLVGLVDGQRTRFEVLVPALEVPGFMVAVVSHGGSILREVADEWRRGDCATCRNVRMVQVERPNGSAWSEHCPDCNTPGHALTGYPVPHREGEPSTAV